MARHESQFTAESEYELGLAEVVGALAPALSDRERQDAIVCYLTRGDGWQDALKLLGGAFAPDPRQHQS